MLEAEEVLLKFIKDKGPLSFRELELSPPEGFTTEKASSLARLLWSKGVLKVDEDLKIAFIGKPCGVYCDLDTPEHSELCVYAEVTDTKEYSKVKKVKKTRSKKAPKAQKVRAKKESDERYTPEDVLDVVRAVGPIALDPCTTEDNRTKATFYYTFEMNGLLKDWYAQVGSGHVFSNPPFSDLMAWIKKYKEEGDKGCNITALLPGDTSTKWFQDVVFEHASAICFWRGRIEFIRTSKAFGQGAMQPTNFIFWGPDVDAFEKAFSPYGKVIRLKK